MKHRLDLAAFRRDANQATQFSRAIQFDRAGIDSEARTVPATLTSNARIEEFPGLFLTLRHDGQSVDLSRSKDGLPLLFNHNRDAWLGVVENIVVRDGMTRGVMRFADNDRAEEVFKGVHGGFLRNVSAVGPVHEVEPEPGADDGFIATRWGLHEASVVTVPKDASVGIARAKHLHQAIASEVGGDQVAPATLQRIAEKLGLKVDYLKGVIAGRVPLVSQETLLGLARGLGIGVDPLVAAARLDGCLIRRDDNDDLDDDDDDPTVVPIQQARRAGHLDGERQGREAERARITQIRTEFSRFEGPDVEALRDDCIAQGFTVARSRRLLLEYLGGGTAPVSDGAGTVRRESVQAGEDARDKFRRGAEVSILERAQLLPKERRPETEGNEFRGFTLLELARGYLANIGHSTRGMDRMAMVGQAFIRVSPGQGSSDFANLLADVANKSAGRGYEDAPESWRGYCRIGSLSDFKVGTRPVLSLFDSLDEIPESGEYKYGNFSDKAENIQLATFGKLWGVTRKTIINDDLNQLTRVPMKLGAAAARVPGDLVVTNILLGNPTMVEDTTALFHANHGNLVAGGSGAAPSVATLQAAETAMATQTSPATKTESGKTIGIPLAHLIVPVALKSTARVLRAAQYDPAGTAGTLTPNPFMDAFEVHADHRIDSNDAAKWFAAADPNRFDTIEVAFLDGNDAPFLEEDSPITVDGMVMKVRLDVGASALDYRGLYHNDGN